MPKPRAATIDVEFTKGIERFGLLDFMGKATLVYGSPLARNRKGIAFETPEDMLQIAEAMKAKAERWQKEIQK